MKKFSIALLSCLLLPTLLLPTLALAQAQLYPAEARQVEKAKNLTCRFLDNAPSSHTVVKGDTLWDISAKFLATPWCWPRVWDMNTSQIRNPHWIYPGQIVYFDRATGKLRLGGTPTVKLSPTVREAKVRDDGALPSIPSYIIEPFLSQPLVVDSASMKDAARIVAVQEGRIYLGRGEIAYVKGIKGIASQTGLYQVFRPGKALLDPDSKEVLAYESAFLGTLRATRNGRNDEPDTFVVENSQQEITVGDRVLPLEGAGLINYAPHAPDFLLSGRVIGVYGGVNQAGSNMIVSLNRGKTHGLEIGHVLELVRGGKTIVDKTDNNKKLKLPDEKYGALFVFRTFDKISYGLVMRVTEPVQIGDAVSSPE
jgi:hypothetical protein